MSNRRFFLSLLLLLSSTLLKSQQNDFGVWNSWTFDMRVHKLTAIEVSQSLRFYENSTELGNHFYEIGIKQKIYGGLRVDLYYRLSNRRQINNSYDMGHRIAIDLRYKFDIYKNLSMTLRTRYQRNINLLSDDFLREPINHAWRNKITLGYKINSQFSAYWNIDLLNRIDRNLLFRRFRTATGINYKPHKSHEISLGFIYEKDFNRRNAFTDYIVKTGYTYEIDIPKIIKKKKKKKKAALKKLSS